MANTRVRGSGSIDKRSGNFRARYKAPDGTRPQKTFVTYKDAAAWLRSETSKMDSGQWKPTGDLTVGEWIPEFISLYKPRAALATLQSYEYSIARLNSNCPGFMSMKCSNVDEITGQRVINTLAKKYHSRTVEITMTLVVMSLRRLLGFNPLLGTHIQASEESFGGKCMSLEDQQILLTKSKKIDQDYGLMFWLMYRTGCRTGEARAMRKGDLKNNVWRISQAMDREGSLKRVKSNQVRSVPIHDQELLNKLKSHAKTKSDLMFTTSTGTPYQHKSLRRELRRILPNHNLHDIRHTFCTEFVRSGRQMAHLSAITGDKVDTLMKYYTHVNDSDVSAALNGFDPLGKTYMHMDA